MIVMIDTLRVTFLLMTENVIAGTDCDLVHASRILAIEA